MKTETKTNEHFRHDVCPKCGQPYVPAEKVPDQTLRGCRECGEVWTEDLSRTPTKHTPGPWSYELQADIDPDGNGYCWAINGLTKDQRQRSIPGADYVQNPAYANSEANARLIAAAPELLSTLEDIRAWLVSPDLSAGVIAAYQHDCEIAIAKATGK